MSSRRLYRAGSAELFGLFFDGIDVAGTVLAQVRQGPSGQFEQASAVGLIG